MTIYSLPLLINNSYFSCINFFNFGEKIKIGIKINSENDQLIILSSINPHNIIKRDNKLFDSFIMNLKYLSFSKEFENENEKFKNRLKKRYFTFPYYLLKRTILINQNEWFFGNIYNNYFCSCRGDFCFNFISFRRCKYYYYLFLLDFNRNIYPKTDILFYDFIFSEYSSDDAYPIFKTMEAKNFPVYYITEDQNIYKQHNKKKWNQSSIILVNKNNYTINGDFLEKYFHLFLRLKQVVTNGGVNIFYINNIFYDLDYCTFIGITHGVCYFKYYLYNEKEIYGIKYLDKILLPPSKIIINMAEKYGWKDENIIKLNLPKWDKFLNNEKQSLYRSIKSKSIFLMFTWRKMVKNKLISPQYWKNILQLLDNISMNQEVRKKNITIYFTIHHKMNEEFNNILNILNKTNIHFISETQIFDCLKNIDLLITDFSSILFETIYRKKPYVIFIPDGNDIRIKFDYTIDYYEIINSFKNGKFHFENIYFNLDEAIEQINFYIKNDFKLDNRLKILYKELNLKHDNNTSKFIEYLSNS